MTKYLFAYRTPAEYAGSPETSAMWNTWFAEIDGSLQDRGFAALRAARSGNCAEGTKLAGYSIIEAADLDAATAIAATCPALTTGGGVEIGELRQA